MYEKNIYAQFLLEVKQEIRGMWCLICKRFVTNAKTEQKFTPPLPEN